jgi:hypothetical protein
MGSEVFLQMMAVALLLKEFLILYGTIQDLFTKKPPLVSTLNHD